MNFETFVVVFEFRLACLLIVGYILAKKNLVWWIMQNNWYFAIYFQLFEKFLHFCVLWVQVVSWIFGRVFTLIIAKIIANTENYQWIGSNFPSSKDF